MQQLGEFIVNHWDLFLALAIILAFMFGGAFSSRLRGFRSIDPLEAVRLINHEDGLLLDVREDSEYQGGHVNDSLHIPLRSLGQRVNDLAKYREKPIIVACQSGMRSSQACGVLRKEGFETVYNLKGGVMAWQNAGMPLAKGGKRKKRK